VARAGSRGDDPVTAYARAVTDGQVITNRLVRLACQRHLDDLGGAASRGLRFDVQAAQHAIAFFGFLRHSKGEWAGETFVLAPWQAFVVGSLFGWQRTDGLRRFRTAYCAVPRKNGKSTLSAGIALYLLVADGEQGAEIYSAATTRDQARIVFDEAKRMVGSSPALKRRVQVLINNLHVDATASRFMPLSSDASSMDGLNVHGAIIDELHAHKTRNVVDVLETATGARRQPLLFEITTAGYDRHSICYEHHDYAIKLLEGTLQHDSWFAFIASADEGDDWTDPAVWRKANPSFGISVKEDDLARKAEKAIALPGAQNAFRRMHLNEWTEQAERWIDMTVWDACSGPVDVEQLRGRTCFGGLDLSATTDVTALAWVFPPDDDNGLWYLLSRYFVPEENLRKRAERDRVPYDLWTRQGFIEATPGNVVDYSAIEQRILADAALFQVKEIAYDPWNATHIALRLQDEGAAMVEFRQGFRSMAAPTRELEKLIVSKKLAHGCNPVTRWMAAKRRRRPGSCRQPQARQGQVHRADRRHRRRHHGHRPRHGRPRRSPSSSTRCTSCDPLDGRQTSALNRRAINAVYLSKKSHCAFRV
jgi:phage terminase large subunit-like protein